VNSERGVVLDSTAIQQVIPHRPPFLLIDRVLELEPDERIVAVCEVSETDLWLAGHFPDYPVMPAVLIVEALAQSAAVLMMQARETTGKIPFFGGIDKARFRRPVRPGEELLLELTLLQRRSDSSRLKGVASVGNEIAAEAEILAILRAPN
jgi:3-hydroxyacyl-[acyl-carrier-protein] dehydratase